MRILITGGCGFIGSHLAERLIRENHEVTIIDKQVCGQKVVEEKSIATYQIGAEDAKCDQIIQDHEIDCIVHLASESVPKEGLASAQVMHTNNISLSNVLFLAQKHLVSKVIVISSILVYGPQNSSLINEHATLNPKTEAGKRYLTREMICMEQQAKGLNVILIRTGHIYGPQQSYQDDNGLQIIMESARLANPNQQTITEGNPQDYIFIGDFVDALFRVVEHASSPVLNVNVGKCVTSQEIQSIVAHILHAGLDAPPSSESSPTLQDEGYNYEVDNHQAMSELDWMPRVSLEEGIKRTIEWAKKQPIQAAAAILPSKDRHWLAYVQKNQQNFAVFAAFLVAAFATYLMQYRMQIDADWLIPYVVLISILYGLKHGSLAIALSIIAKILFVIFLDGIRVIDLVNNASSIIYLTMYFAIGISIGYITDHRKTEEECKQKEMESIKSDLQFVNHLYQNALEVKSAMQNTIENNTNSFGKSLEIIKRLMNTEPEMIYSEAAKIIASILKARTVHIYLVNSQHQFLRLASVSGTLKYGKSIQISQFSTLSTAVEQYKIVINRNLDANQPLVCAPIFHNGQVPAVVLIDDVDFKMLTQQFVNILQVMTMLISNSLDVEKHFESFVKDKKYFHQTLIMRKEWFRRILDAQLAKELHSPQSIFVLKMVVPISEYWTFSRQAAGLIREQDIMGEIDEDQVGIILSNAQPADISIVQQRFEQNGIETKIIDIREI